MAGNLESLKRELAQADLFLEWDDLMLELVASVCEERSFQRGEQIFGENSINDELFIIASGSVEIRVNPQLVVNEPPTTDQSLQTIAVLRRGQNFGEVALLDEGRRTAAAVCAENNTRLIVVPRDKIILMCENVPRLGYLLMRNLAADLATKIRNTDLDIRSHLTWVPSNRPAK